MDQIKKKLAALKDEREAAVERADDAEAQRKEAEGRADAVRSGILHTHRSKGGRGYAR